MQWLDASLRTIITNPEAAELYANDNSALLTCYKNSEETRDLIKSLSQVINEDALSSGNIEAASDYFLRFDHPTNAPRIPDQQQNLFQLVAHILLNQIALCDTRVFMMMFEDSTKSSQRRGLGEEIEALKKNFPIEDLQTKPDKNILNEIFTRAFAWVHDKSSLEPMEISSSDAGITIE